MSDSIHLCYIRFLRDESFNYTLNMQSILMKLLLNNKAFSLHNVLENLDFTLKCIALITLNIFSLVIYSLLFFEKSFNLNFKCIGELFSAL